jgi:hypothetical protein
MPAVRPGPVSASRPSLETSWARVLHAVEGMQRTEAIRTVAAAAPEAEAARRSASAASRPVTSVRPGRMAPDGRERGVMAVGERDTRSNGVRGIGSDPAARDPHPGRQAVIRGSGGGLLVPTTVADHSDLSLLNSAVGGKLRRPVPAPPLRGPSALRAHVGRTSGARRAHLGRTSGANRAYAQRKPSADGVGGSGLAGSPGPGSTAL